MTEPFHTADGVKIVPHMKIWVHGEIYPEPPIGYFVESVSEDGTKVIFPGPYGTNDYHGARASGCFSTPEACIAAIAKTRVKLDLDKDEAHLILFALAKELKRVRSDLAAISIAKDRELTKSEYIALPILVGKPTFVDGKAVLPTREEIAEQINPWVSLVQDYEYIIKIVQKAHDESEKR